MLKAYKYRIYPNMEQRVQIAKTFGCFYRERKVASFLPVRALEQVDADDGTDSNCWNI